MSPMNRIARASLVLAAVSLALSLVAIVLAVSSL